MDKLVQKFKGGRPVRPSGLKTAKRHLAADYSAGQTRRRDSPVTILHMRMAISEAHLGRQASPAVRDGAVCDQFFDTPTSANGRVAREFSEVKKIGSSNFSVRPEWLPLKLA